MPQISEFSWLYNFSKSFIIMMTFFIFLSFSRPLSYFLTHPSSHSFTYSVFL